MTTSNMKKPFSVLPLVLVVLAGLAGIYWLNSQPRKAETTATAPAPLNGGGFSKALAIGPMAGVVIPSQRKTIAPFTFKDANGKDLGLSAFKGHVVLLNLWATWCSPCRKEMPDIAKLQKDLGGTDFEVVALSVDRKGLEASQAFLTEIGADSLKAYTDQESKSLAAIQALGLPASVLIDRNGMEAARILGPAQWASPEAEAMIKVLIAEK
jgi:thiol-disulfide isomerase/thioredoxin